MSWGHHGLGSAAGLLLCVLAAFPACTSEEDKVALYVDLRTDFVPGHEFSSAEVLVSVPDAPNPLQDEVAVGSDDVFVDGKRVAEFPSISRGDYRVVVRLRKADGALLGERTAAISVRNDYLVTIVITRNCADIVCEDAASACLDGQCVSERCTPETADECAEDSCETDAQCPSIGAVCSRPVCREGTCLQAIVDPPVCTGSMYCDPNSGCRDIRLEETVWCEATGVGRCYYIDATNGDDTNDGSFEHPFETYLNIVSYYNVELDRPSTAVDLYSGDAVYFMDGTYAETYAYDAGTNGPYFRNMHGAAGAPIRIEAYPGHRPVIAPEGTGGITVYNSSHLAISGFEIVDPARHSGLRIEQSQWVHIANMHIHDIDGTDNGNPGGILILGSENVQVMDSVLHDNYDRTAEDTGGMPTTGSTNVAIYRGGNIDFGRNHVYNTPETSAGMHGGCVVYAAPRSTADGIFHVFDNQFESCAFFGIRSGTPSVIERNLIREGAGIRLRGGGTGELQNILVQNNTIIGDGAMALYPEESAPEFPITGIVYRQNVAIDDSRSYSGESAFLAVGTYASDEDYLRAIEPENLAIDDNCYFNLASTALEFDFFGANGGSSGSLGGEYDMAGWQALGFDTNTYVGDPMLDPTTFVAQAEQCTGRGRF
jgi:hypothetical protein